MNAKPLVCLILMHVLAACAPPESSGAAGAGPAERLAALEGSDDTEAWYQLSLEAGLAGELDVAEQALEEAAELGLSPARATLQRARLAVLRDAPQKALAELEQLAEAGFTAVSAISDDPVLSSLAGRPQYDELVAALSEEAWPCEHQEKFREFDFWIGEWEVHTADGRLAGHNVIEPAQHGCVLLERWTSAVHGGGMSINYLDSASDEWVQVWLDAGGGQIEIRGGLTEEGMRLEGVIRRADGSSAPFRGLWTPLPDGRVRQFFEQSADGGESWSPWFEGYYSRIDEQP